MTVCVAATQEDDPDAFQQVATVISMELPNGLEEPTDSEVVVSHTPELSPPSIARKMQSVRSDLHAEFSEMSLIADTRILDAVFAQI